MAVDTKKFSASDAIDVIKLVNDCMKQINEGEKLLGHVNIIIAGKTGVGKSTLINAAFRDNLAETGMGMPVTQSSKIIESEGMPLRIYDTVGLELTEKMIQKKLDDDELGCIMERWTQKELPLSSQRVRRFSYRKGSLGQLSDKPS